ncbi:Translation machinery-associated protein 16, putative [Angomonas deanei]|uniref:Translation machinery-associated protein 16, putative n=1 Tax=Angomonas deanei TaxID=59799 RepID=A0A7G2C0E4_9TRYP|nr:Translation machinery-associated protein 16, putative [Angomonas deanei]
MEKIRTRVAREVKSLSHPRDRRVRQIEKREKRGLRVLQQKERQKNQHQQRLNRYEWLKDSVFLLGVAQSEAGCLSEEDVLLLVQVYIERHIREANKLRRERNHPRGLVKQLHNAYEAEMAELRSTQGMMVPQLDTPKAVAKLLEWDGTMEGSKSLDTVTVSLDTRVLERAKVDEVAALLVDVDGEEHQKTARAKRVGVKKTARRVVGGGKANLKLKSTVRKSLKKKRLGSK